MTDQRIIGWIRTKFHGLGGELTERARRCWAAVEAQSLGHGGISAVSEATGLARTTIRRGLTELRSKAPPESGRQRRAGAGRKKAVETNPNLKAALEQLVEPESRVDPQSPLRWTCKSTRRLARALTRQGHRVGPTTVRQLLKEAGYRLQANRKTRAGQSQPDRDGQFLQINRRVKSQQRRGQPTISVDTKKKGNRSPLDKKSGVLGSISVSQN